MIINLKERTLEAFGRKKNLVESSIGHPIVKVVPVERDPIIRDEVLVMAEADDVEMSEEEQRKDIRKLHRQAGHPSKAKMRDFLNKCSRKWDRKVKWWTPLRQHSSNFSGGRSYPCAWASQSNWSRLRPGSWDSGGYDSLHR